MLPEQSSLSNLNSSSNKLPAHKLEALKDFFQRLRDLDDAIARLSPHELYESKWAILGIISRSYQLMLCCIDQLAKRNWNGFYAAARGLVETLCAVVWVNENTNRLLSLVHTEGVQIGRLLNVGYKKYPDLKGIYKFLSGITHPNRNSHLLGPRPSGEWSEKGVWSPFNLSFSDFFANENIDLLVIVCSRIMDELEYLASGGADVIIKGRVMSWLATNKRKETTAE